MIFRFYVEKHKFLKQDLHSFKFSNFKSLFLDMIFPKFILFGINYQTLLSYLSIANIQPRLFLK